MGMQKVALEELSQPVREFLSRVKAGQGILVEDEAGQTRYGVIEYIKASPAEQQEAWGRIRQLQRKTKQTIEEQGGTVEEIERLILADED